MHSAIVGEININPPMAYIHQETMPHAHANMHACSLDKVAKALDESLAFKVFCWQINYYNYVCTDWARSYSYGIRHDIHGRHRHEAIWHFTTGLCNVYGVPQSRYEDVIWCHWTLSPHLLTGVVFLLIYTSAWILSSFSKPALSHTGRLLIL